MSAVSYVTNRGRSCAETAKENGGWRDGTGAQISGYPSHGNWYYVLVLDIVGFSDLRDVNTCGDAGISLTPQGNGYAPVATTRNSSNFPVVEDDTNDQATCACPNATWTAAGGSISAKYLAKCDGNPFAGAGASAANIVDLFDLQGLRTSPDGQPFTVTNIVTGIGKPVGEP